MDAGNNGDASDMGSGYFRLLYTYLDSQSKTMTAAVPFTAYGNTRYQLICISTHLTAIRLFHFMGGEVVRQSTVESEFHLNMPIV